MPNHISVPWSWLIAMLMSGAIGLPAVTADAPPTIAKPAAATPAMVTAKTTTLSVLGADDKAATALRYKWTATGPAPVAFSANGTNNAKTVTAAFKAVGSYTCTVMVGDMKGQIVSSSVTVRVEPALSAIAISPATVKLDPGASTEFTAMAKDQFGGDFATPDITWSAKGAVTIDATGYCTADTVPGPASVTVTSGTKTATATVVINVPGGIGAATATPGAPGVKKPIVSTPANAKPAAPAVSILPANREGNWRSAGVPGGIPTTRTNLIDVSKAPYNADLSGGANAQPAIMQAIAKAVDNDVVYLPAGTYRVNSPITVNKSNITIRGAGPDKTILMAYNNDRGGAIDINFLTQGNAFWTGSQRLPITGSPVKGATVLQMNTAALAGFPRGGLGQICKIALKNDLKLPVMAPGGGDYLRMQVTRIIEKTATSITISPPLLFDLPEALAPLLTPSDGQVEFVGVEDLTINGANSNTRHSPLTTGQNFGCWFLNVGIVNVPKWHFLFTDALQCTIKRCYLAKRTRPMGPDGGGLMFGGCSSCLIEDNVLVEAFPHIEVTNSSGNVFAYNFCDDKGVQGGLLGGSINTNHGGHPSFNLYEGNVTPKLQCDGYHSSGSDDTVFRNWIHGTSENAQMFWVCINLNRFTRNYSIIGNVLGCNGHSWQYEASSAFGYDSHLIYAFGFPGMGNGGASGTAQPSAGKNWADWERFRSGQAPGTGGFQELDLDVKATTLLKGNFNYKDRGVPANEAFKGALPRSLYLTRKPAWFGTLAWPAFGPDADPAKNKIPAQIRYEEMTQRPSVPTMK